MSSQSLSADEIAMAVKDCDSEKAPGPDGFPTGVIWKGWRFMQQDFLKTMKGFHVSGNMKWRMNNTFLALNPEKREALRVGEYKTIILVYNSYKVLAKILANRVKGCLGGIVVQAHGAFIKG